MSKKNHEDRILEVTGLRLGAEVAGFLAAGNYAAVNCGLYSCDEYDDDDYLGDHFKRKPEIDPPVLTLTY